MALIHGKQFVCPGKDLGHLARTVGDVLFYLAFDEKPDRSKIEARLRRNGDVVLDWEHNLLQQTDLEYQRAMMIYEDYKEPRKKFVQYFGINPIDVDKEDWEELRESAHSVLKKHIESCGNCRRRYLDLKNGFLTRGAKASAEEWKRRGYNYKILKGIKGFDRMHVGLLGLEEE